jgi:hypothetical protein
MRHRSRERSRERIGRKEMREQTEEEKMEKVALFYFRRPIHPLWEWVSFPTSPMIMPQSLLHFKDQMNPALLCTAYYHH